MKIAGLFRVKWLLFPILLLLATGLYALFGFWLVPKIIRSQAIDYADTELKKPLSLGEIRFNPFKFQLDISDARIDDQGKPLLALKHLFVDFQLSSVWKGAYVFNSIKLDAPYARAIIRSDGSLNLADLVPKDEDPDGALPEVLVRNLDVAQGRIDFADNSRRLKPEKTLSPIDFHLENFRTTAEGGGFRLAAASEREERFDWNGRLSLRPFSSTGKLALSGLKAETIHAFVGDELPFVLSAGSFDLGADYVFSAADRAGTRLDVTLPKITGTALGIRARGVDTDWVGLPLLALDSTKLSLTGKQVDVGAIRIEGLKAKVWMNPNGSLNVEQLLADAAPAPAGVSMPSSAVASGAGPSPAKEWKVTVAQFRLQQGMVELQDRIVKPAANFTLSPLAFTASDLSLDMTRPVPITMDTTLNLVAPLSLKGTVVPKTVAATLDVDLSRMPLRDLLPYLPQYPTLRLKSGDVAAKGKLSLRPADAPGPELEFIGEAAVAGFDLREVQGDREFLSWNRVDAKGLHYSAGPDAVKINTLTVNAPYARVTVNPDQTINLVSILGGAAPAASAPAAAPGAGISVSVGKVAMSAGTMSFADYSIDPNFRARIDALHGTLLGISTATDSVAKIDLKGQIINKHSPVSITGETNLLAYDKHTDVKMAFNNIELPIFNPYSGRFAGYAISKGKLSTELHYQIDNRALIASHHVVVDQLEWGAATDSKDKVSLPVRLATSLLKDRHGVIDLNLPVTGSLDDPKFRIGPIVWQVIKNIVVKVVTAPFGFLGSLFKGAEEAQFVDFPPGSAELTEKAKGNLAMLATGLAEKQELKIDIPAAPAGEADAAALTEQRLVAALSALQGDKDKKTDIGFDALDADHQLDLLKALYKQKLAKKPEFPEAPQASEDASRKEKRNARDLAEIDWLKEQLRPQYTASAGDLSVLGQARASAVQEALLADGKLEPTRVFLATGQGALFKEGVVRIELQLK